MPYQLALAKNNGVIISAARVFDGYEIRTDSAVLIVDGVVSQIGDQTSFQALTAERIDLGNATLLPGFIELHAHLSFQNVPSEIVLKHGITTLRDVGGPLHMPYGGNGQLRVMTSGPIITAPHGYPIPMLGEKDIAIPVASEDQARETVRKLVSGGAAVIKIALEPGGESGAPWSAHEHAHRHHHDNQESSHSAPGAWPLLPEPTVRTIVDEAHKLDRKVTAHIAEQKGAEIALNAGVDEWAHTPCENLPDQLLRQAIAQKVKVVSTIDTLSKCPGAIHNAKRLAAMGGEFLYGSEIAHPDVPWGINAQELMYLQHLTDMSPLETIKTATSKAGSYLGISLLGTLLPGAPADLIAVKGDPTQKLKLLEYPDLVISGGKIIVNNFSNSIIEMSAKPPKTMVQPENLLGTDNNEMTAK